MNQRVIDDPTLIGWVQDGTTSDGDPIYKWASSGGGSGGSVSGVGMVISETEPTDKVEGMQWLETPADGDAVVWLWDGAVWLQMPTTGAAGKDGADGLWTDNGDTTISYMDGNVGIGRENPTVPLVVFDKSAAGDNTVARLAFNTTTTAGTGGKLQFTNAYGTELGYVKSSVEDSSNVGLTFGTFSGSGTTERMTITADGNVGIGTTSTSYKTEISTDGTTYVGVTSGDSSLSGILFGKESNKSLSRIIHDNNDRSLQLWSNSQERMRIDVNGNVGIGKDDPKGKLEVDGLIVAKRLSGSDRPTNNAIGGFGFNRNGTAMQGMYLNATDDLFIHNSLSTGKVIFSRASGEETMKLLANGRIGMGVENPSVKLDVNGTIKATNVTRNGIPVIDAKGLIETLATLRQATMDEAQDIRESLRAAIDELMEKFEQQIATMPAGDSE